MSQTIRVTTTTTRAGTVSDGCCTLSLNRTYMRTIPGFLKTLELIFGCVTIILLSIYNDSLAVVADIPNVFYLCMVSSFLYGTFCLLISCMLSLATSGLITKTIFECIYHLLTSIILFIVSIVFITSLRHYYNFNFHTGYIIAGVFGVMNSICYMISAIISFRAYKGW